MKALLRCGFHTIAARSIKKNKLPPRPKLSTQMETELEEKFLHGGRGPGGQKINKCNSKVQLKHLPSGIVVECQETRSRDQNRKLAREKLALRIAQWQGGGGPVAREVALHEWERQGKRSKERKSKDKHVKHQEVRRSAEMQKLQEEEDLLRSLLT